MRVLIALRSVVRFLPAIIVCWRVTTVFGSGEPQESFTYQNFAKAMNVLERAIAAHGGAELYDRAVNIRFSYTGTYRLEGHFARPWARRDYRMDGITAYSADLKAAKSEVTFYENDKPSPSFAIMGTANGLRLNGGASRPDSIPQTELEGSIREEFEVLPHEYLRQARDGAAGLRLLSGSDGYDVLHYTLDNGESRALFLDVDTHLLTRVERIDHWTHKGDRLEWRTFSDYVDQNGIKVPLKSEVHIEESSGQHNVVSEITKIEFGAMINADEFTIPAAHREGFETWALEPPHADSSAALLAYQDLGHGAYVIELPPSDSRSLLVAFSDFSVIVETGDRSELSARILATADYILPDKPVRYVAMTHHHPLYANGLRPYVQRGVTVLATAGDTAYYRDLCTRPYRIQPDLQQREPREPIFEQIDGTRIIEDGAQRLELHQFEYSTHVDEFVLAYLPSHKLIVTGDLVYAVRDEELRPASGRARAVHRVVTERNLDVENIMQTWFLTRSDHLTPYSVLEEMVRLAEAKSAKN